MSDSTENVGRIVKLDEYKALPGLDYILLAACDMSKVALWYRDTAAQWQLQVLGTLDDVLDLPLLGVRLALLDVYDRVTLREPAG